MDRSDDPLRDMERRLDSLAARVDLTDQQVRNDLYGLKADLSEIRKKLAAEFVTRVEFTPVRAIAFGLVAIILTAVATAIVGQVIVS